MEKLADTLRRFAEFMKCEAKYVRFQLYGDGKWWLEYRDCRKEGQRPVPGLITYTDDSRDPIITMQNIMKQSR